MKYPEINRKLEIERGYLSNLKSYTEIPTEVLISNDEKILAMERLYQLVVDEAADINSYIAYQVLNKVPESYKSSFHLLADGDLLNREFVDMIAESVKIRNQIVHDYEKLQKSESVEAIKKFFPMYEKYLDLLVKRFVSNTE